MLVEAIRSPEVAQFAQSFKTQSKNAESSVKQNPPVAPAEKTVVNALESGKAVQATASVSEAVTARNAVPDSAPESSRFLETDEVRQSMILLAGTNQNKEKKPATPEALSRQAKEITDSFSAPVDEQHRVFVDESTGQLGMRVIDKDTGEVLRQIPPEELLKMIANLRESIGAFIDHRS